MGSTAFGVIIRVYSKRQRLKTKEVTINRKATIETESLTTNKKETLEAKEMTINKRLTTKKANVNKEANA